jgi:hypothetical protein
MVRLAGEAAAVAAVVTELAGVATVDMAALK